MSDEQTRKTPAPSELELLRAEIRAGFQSVEKRFDGVDRRFDGVDRRFDGVDRRLDTIDKRLDGHDTRLDGHDSRFVSIETRITTEAEATRRHFDVVAEGLRADFQVVIDKTVATGKKVDKLIASNATEHAAFIEAIADHEVRITRLEGAVGQDPTSPAANRQT